MAKYLIYHNSKGRIIEVPPKTSADYYGQLQRGFAAEAGKDSTKANEWQYADMIPLHDDQKIGEVWYDYELVNINGAHFTLIQLPDTTPEQLETAKKKIRQDRDVVGMSVVRIREMI